MKYTTYLQQKTLKKKSHLSKIFKEGNSGGHDCPELEDINFRIKNRHTTIRINISYSNIQGAHVDLLAGNVSYKALKYYGNIEETLSPKMIDVVVAWLDRRELIPPAQEIFSEA